MPDPLTAKPAVQATDPETAAHEVNAARERITSEVHKVIVGQDQVLEELLIAMFCSGHALVVGVPGLAKTRLVDTLGTVLGLDTNRIQFTPDLMPADILGSEVLEEGPDGSRAFRFIDGPVFTQLLMADEINRASPRTQSALLQAMQEKSVTIAGQPHDLEAPFHVLATQNPLEQEGTYPLPEAQLDRFLVQVDVAYPDRDTERDILIATTGATEEEAHAVFTAEELIKAQALLRKMPVGEQVVEMILDLVRACRPHEPEATPAINASVAWGPGPRAAQALMLTIRARALLDGRLAPSPADVIAMAKPVLIHRMAMTFAARARGEDLASIIDTVAATLSENRSAA